MGDEVGRYEVDLRRRAYQYSIDIIKFLDLLPNEWSTRVLAKQLLRSATSVGANLVESKVASSRKDYANFFLYSLKSANESLYWLGLLRDAKRVSSNSVQPLLKETQEIANIIGASVVTLRKQ